jgi:hypothetical protein
MYMLEDCQRIIVIIVCNSKAVRHPGRIYFSLREFLSSHDNFLFYYYYYYLNNQFMKNYFRFIYRRQV